MTDDINDSIKYTTNAFIDAILMFNKIVNIKILEHFNQPNPPNYINIAEISASARDDNEIKVVYTIAYNAFQNTVNTIVSETTIEEIDMDKNTLIELMDIADNAYKNTLLTIINFVNNKEYVYNEHNYLHNRDYNRIISKMRHALITAANIQVINQALEESNSDTNEL